jgi:hypothetical protein
MVGMFQNMSQRRSEGNRKITSSDIKHAFCSAHLSAYLGIYSILADGSGYHRYGHAPHGWIYYLKGEGSNVRCFWRFQVEAVHSKTIPFNVAVSTPAGTENRSFVRIAVGETKSPAAVYSGLSISDGEVKIIVEVAPYFDARNGGSYYLDGSVAASAKKAFGFFLVDPKTTSYAGRETFFDAIVIFTPNPGLFNETAPR